MYEAAVYRVYASDMLRAVNISLGQEVEERYFEIIRPKPVDNRSGEEIAAEVISRLGLKAV